MTSSGPGKFVGMDIQRMVVQELGNLGLMTLRKQCQNIRKAPEEITMDDLLSLSQKMTKALRPLVGDTQAKKVGKDIHKFKLLHELDKLTDQATSPDIERKELSAYSTLGNICYSIGEWDEALEYFGRALQLGKKLNDDLRVSEAYRHIGHIYKRRSEWDDALDNFKKALTISHLLRHPAGVSDSYRGIGYVLWRRGHYEEAEFKYSRALQVAKKSGDRHTIGIVHIEFGLVCSDIGDQDKAIEQYQKALEILESVRDYEQMARAFNNLGDIFLQREDWQNAIKHFDQARKSAEKINHRLAIAWSWFNSAEARIKADQDIDEAIEMCKKALDILERMEDYVGICAVFRDLGVAYTKKKNWGEAESNFRKAQHVLSEINSPFNNGHLYLEWGRMYKEKGDPEKAEIHLSKSADIFEDINAKVYYKMARKELSSL